MAAQCLNCLNGSLLLQLAAAVLMLHSLMLQGELIAVAFTIVVKTIILELFLATFGRERERERERFTQVQSFIFISACNHAVTAVSDATCYKGVVLQAHATNNSTINVHEGAILIVHCRYNLQVYQDLTLTNCKEVQAHDLSVQTEKDLSTKNITWFCHVTRNTSRTIEVSGFTAGSGYHVNLFELDTEVHDLEQCLADARTTPSPCTTPPPTNPTTISTTMIATTETISTTETTTTNEPSTTTTSTLHPTEAETIDPTESPDLTDPSNLDTIQQNETTDLEEVKKYPLYGAVCVLGVIVIVQFWVIVLLAVKLCCGKRREKEVEEGKTVTDQRQNSDEDKGTVIPNRESIHMETSMNLSISKTKSCTFF